MALNELLNSLFMLAAISLAAAFLMRAATLMEVTAAPSGPWPTLMPLAGGALTLFLIAARNIDLGRLLSGLAIAAAVCPLLAARSGSASSMALYVAIASSAAFVALPIALAWTGARYPMTAHRAGFMIAAAVAGRIPANYVAADFYDSPLSLTVVSGVLLAITVPLALMLLRKSRKQIHAPSAIPAVGAVLADPALLGLIAAGLIVSGSQTALQQLLQLNVMGDLETHAGAYVLNGFGSLVALVVGGVLADGASLNNRGYAIWIAAMLALSGVVAMLVTESGPPSPELMLMISGWLASASTGAFFARFLEMRSAAGRLPGLMVFAAGRLLGAQMGSTILFDRLAGGDNAKALSFAAIGMIVAALIVIAAQRLARRRN